MIPKTVSALDAGSPPDVAYADVYDFQVTGKWAFDGKLEDICDVIRRSRPGSPEHPGDHLLYNDKAKKRAYYAFPLKQQTMHIEYWADMLEKAGLKESDIPKNWKEYWSFWCDKVQPAYRRSPAPRVRHRPADGRRLERLLLLVPDLHGRLQRQARRRRRQAARRRSQGEGRGWSARSRTTPVLRKGCTPPSSTSWKDPDNNVAFHNKTTVMTHNATISIAAKWLDDTNNEALTPSSAPGQEELRRTDPHRGLPEKAGRLADGLPRRGQDRRRLRGGHEQGARQGVRRLPAPGGEPHALCRGCARPLVPGHHEGQESPFWQEDPHRKAAYNQFKAGTVTFEFAKNWRFTVLNNENVWAKAMNRVINEKVPVDKAVDEMIARIKQVAG